MCPVFPSIEIVVILFLFGVVAVWCIPKHQTADLKTGEADDLRKKLELENEFRKTVATVVGGLFGTALLGYFVQVRRAELELQTRYETRVNQAITFLAGATAGERIRGVAELRSLAEDRPENYQEIAEILSGHLRQQHSPWPARGDGSPAPETRAALFALGRVVALAQAERGELTPEELRSLLNLKKINASELNLTQLMLPCADLRGANFSNSRLDSADLSDSDLTRALLAGDRTWLYETNLAGATLTNATLDGARLESATLTDCYLKEASLVEADLTGATLEAAVFKDAVLRSAVMDRSILKGASLEGADLSGAKLDLARDLEMDQLVPAKVDENTTQLPPSIDFEALRAGQARYHFRGVLEVLAERWSAHLRASGWH